MPRISAEARGAAALRAGGKLPDPPKDLSDEAKLVWKAVTASKPVDWFDAGSLVLLEDFCNAAVHARHIEKRIETLRGAEAWAELSDWEKRAAVSTTRLTGLATKLRLSVQANVEWHDRKIGEKGQKEAAGDTLIGGKAVWGEVKAH
jgi:hypothetical protein